MEPTPTHDEHGQGPGPKSRDKATLPPTSVSSVSFVGPVHSLPGAHRLGFNLAFFPSFFPSVWGLVGGGVGLEGQQHRSHASTCAGLKPAPTIALFFAAQAHLVVFWIPGQLSVAHR